MNSHKAKTKLWVHYFNVLKISSQLYLSRQRIQRTISSLQRLSCVGWWQRFISWSPKGDPHKSRNIDGNHLSHKTWHMLLTWALECSGTSEALRWGVMPTKNCKSGRCLSSPYYVPHTVSSKHFIYLIHLIIRTFLEESIIISPSDSAQPEAQRNLVSCSKSSLSPTASMWSRCAGPGVLLSTTCCVVSWVILVGDFLQ